MGQLATIDRRAATWGVVAVLVALAIAGLGSGNLRWFDAALVGYLFGTLFAIFAVVYRYLIWLRRPPTALLNRRGWEAFRRPGRRGRNAAALPGLVVSNLMVQSFIRGRSRSRWLAHQLVFWGCVLAALVTFPLVFGLLHFESVGQNGREYRTVVGEVATFSFASRSESLRFSTSVARAMPSIQLRSAPAENDGPLASRRTTRTSSGSVRPIVARSRHVAGV